MARQPVLQDYGNIQNPAGDLSPQLELMRNMQSDREIAARERQAGKTAKAKEGADATKFITELKNEKTGVNELDIENDKQLLGAQNRMNEMQQKGASLQEIQLYAMRELPKINNAYTLGKNYKAQVEKGMIDLEKKYGNGVDLNAVQTAAYKKMADDIFDRDEKGGITGYKDATVIPKNKDYIAEIENDDASLGTVFKPSGALSANIKKFPTPAISKSEDKRGKDGRTRYNGYTGQGSVFVEEDVDPETGVTKGLRYKSEKVPLGNKEDGTPNYVEVMPENEFGLMTETPAAKKDFDMMFREQMKENGIDPSKLDTRAADILKRGYALEWVKETNIDGSAFNPKMKDIQPSPPRISVKVNNNTGKEEGGGVVGNVLNTLEVRADQKDGTYAMTGAGNKKNLADVQILLEEVLTPEEINSNDKQYKINYEIKNGQVESITVKGIRYDRDFFKRRQEVYDKNPKWAGKLQYPKEQRRIGGEKAQPAKKEIKRADISAKASAAGYSAKEYEALLKKNGVTIKD